MTSAPPQANALTGGSRGERSIVSNALEDAKRELRDALSAVRSNKGKGCTISASKTMNNEAPSVIDPHDNDDDLAKAFFASQQQSSLPPRLPVDEWAQVIVTQKADMSHQQSDCFPAGSEYNGQHFKETSTTSHEQKRLYSQFQHAIEQWKHRHDEQQSI